MNISQDLKKEIFNNFSSIKNVTVEYEKITVNGFIKKITPLPFKVTLCKHEVARNENSEHLINFDNALHVTLEYHNGKKEIHN